MIVIQPSVDILLPNHDVGFEGGQKKSLLPDIKCQNFCGVNRKFTQTCTIP